jgi:hypothetical protein
MEHEVKLADALVHAGLEEAQTSFLGEGAWHYAWKVAAKEGTRVLRIPKAVAYGEKISFDKEALMSEYSGTELYYRNVNRAVAGAAPEFFRFHVSKELTYTIESFAGESLNVRELTRQEAFEIGKAVGIIYRKTEEIPHGLDGCGYLDWSEEEGLKGSLAGNPFKWLQEESQ